MSNQETSTQNSSSSEVPAESLVNSIEEPVYYFSENYVFDESMLTSQNFDDINVAAATLGFGVF